MKLSLTPRAAQDLNAILEYLNERNPAGAQKVSVAIERALVLLGERPYSGRIMKRKRRIRVKVVARDPYLLFYRIEAETIVVVHIRHGAQRRWKGTAS
jgi:toxin ParE1/3/4